MIPQNIFREFWDAEWIEAPVNWMPPLKSVVRWNEDDVRECRIWKFKVYQVINLCNDEQNCFDSNHRKSVKCCCWLRSVGKLLFLISCLTNSFASNWVSLLLLVGLTCWHLSELTFPVRYICWMKKTLNHICGLQKLFTNRLCSWMFLLAKLFLRSFK